MDARVYVPPPALQDYILQISTVNFVLPEVMDNAVTPYPPTPFQTLIFYCNHPISMGRENGTFESQPLTVLIGPQYSRVNIRVHHQLRAIRVDFLPGGMYRLLGIPMNELFDRGFDAQDFFELRDVNDQLQHSTSLEQGKEIVERFLLGQAKTGKDLLPVDRSLRALFECGGDMTVRDAAALSCLSLKQFERKCRDRIGMNPKLYARILKFSKAYRLHEASPQLSWTQIAHEAAYYDHMHMIRDFRDFAGVNPSVIEKELFSTPLRMQKDLPD